jgi:acetoin utilization deacetylase AcuC-like enzyme
MTTALITHRDCLGHAPPNGHPESADRLRAVLRALETPEFSSLVRIEAPSANRTALSRAHDFAGIDAILGPYAEQARQEGLVYLDADTAMSPGSVSAALHAAGAVMAGVDAVMAGDVRNAFCAVRPPGHHAERGRAMGFCLFNNVAVGAHHARDVHALRRIAVVDFDVHHGNGTQDIFFADPELFYASTHQFPLYPGTGRPSETGIADNIVNAPLPPGADGRAFRAAFENLILPALDRFAPNFIFISAGFDAHASDPLAQLRLTEFDFAWATNEICRIAAARSDSRVVSALEGGYDLDALAACSAAHVRSLMNAP